MRKLFLAISFLLPFALIYSLNQNAAEPEAQAVTPAADVLQGARTAQKQISSDVAEVQPQVAPIRRKARKSADTSHLAAAPKLKPMKQQPKPAAKKSLQASKTPKSERNFDNPMADRWLDGNDAQLARFGMAKKSNDIGCSNDVEDCAKRRKDQEVTLVGVVVKTSRVSADPANSIDGDLEQGHYDDYLPTLYLK